MGEVLGCVRESQFSWTLRLYALLGERNKEGKSQVPGVSEDKRAAKIVPIAATTGDAAVSLHVAFPLIARRYGAHKEPAQPVTNIRFGYVHFAPPIAQQRGDGHSADLTRHRDCQEDEKNFGVLRSRQNLETRNPKAQWGRPSTKSSIL